MCFKEDANSNLEIIVSDHADESVLGDIPEEYKHIVANWSNGDALIGEMGLVSEVIKAGGYGRVAIGGDDWKAVSSETADIPVGTRVKVVGRESIIISVERV